MLLESFTEVPHALNERKKSLKIYKNHFASHFLFHHAIMILMMTSVCAVMREHIDV